MALLAATAIVVALTAVSGASAAPTICQGGLANPITSGTHDGIIVPAGEFCVIEATDGAVIEVTGSISVRQGARLDVRAAATGSCGQILIHGSVAATNPLSIFFLADPGCTLRVDGSISVRGASELVQLFNIFVGGSVALRDNAPADSVRIVDSIIDGSVTVRNNTAGDVSVALNSIGGSVTFSTNSGIDVLVTDNTIDGSLACSGNSGQLGAVFGPNTVGGSTSGQCA